MPIIEKGFTQRSEEWFKARLGNPGSSSMDKIITSEGKPSRSRKGLLYQLAAEKIRGISDDTFQSQAMVEGQQKEETAIAYFEFLHDVEVERVALVYKDEQKAFHVSPDGLLSKDGGIEIKAPLAKTHAKYLYENRLPPEYFVQVQSCLYVTERRYWWFMSYCEGMKPLIIEVRPDEKFQKVLAIELGVFVQELNAITKKLRSEK